MGVPSLGMRHAGGVRPVLGCGAAAHERLVVVGALMDGGERAGRAGRMAAQLSDPAAAGASNTQRALKTVPPGATRARRHQCRARTGEPDDAREARGLDDLSQGHRRQDGGEPTRQHRLPRPWGS
jgi:hypothetical protein